VLSLVCALCACTSGGADADRVERDSALRGQAALADARVPLTVPERTASAAEDAGALPSARIQQALQACAYDGTPITVRGDTLSPPTDGACVSLVERIMRFTGLPQNFNVVEAPVPNAAALVLVDDSNTPRRVIAFNRSFLAGVARATGDNPWAPISIMAHEIGHHLSGHTLLPGGSQPPIELEADKFSGFVLYRMGASLSDAQHAMSALVPASAHSSTHPARHARLDAIGQGWRESCAQHGGAACAAGLAELSPPPVPAPPASITHADSDATPAAPASNTAGTAAPAAPPPGATPSKFGRFVYDDYGVLDPAIVAAVEQRLFRHVEEHQVEIVTVLARDTRGLSTQDYAQAMLRQLRVGKLDVGNGAVLVVAPEHGESAIALGPGVALQMQPVIEADVQRLRSFLQISWPYCVKRGACGSGTELLLEAANHIADDTRRVDWRIRHFDLGDMLASATAHAQARDASAPVDVARDPTWQKLLQTEVEVLDTDLPAEGEGYHLNPERGAAALLRTTDARRLIAQRPSSLAELMPSGPLQRGRRYSVVLRASSLDTPTPQFDLLSYVAIDP